MIKRAISGLLALTLIASAFAGCGSKKEESKGAPAASAPSAAPAKKVKISFVYTGGDPLFKQVVADRVASFTKKNPNITIDESPSGSGSYLDYVKTKDAVGEFPDMMESRDTALWARAGKLAVLPDELMALVENPALMDGKAYTIPYAAANTNGIFYNAKMFKDNGLTEPKTYKEFLDLCEKLKSKNIPPLVLGGKDLFHMGFWWGKFWIDDIYTKNPDWIADRYRNKVKFSDPDVVATITKFVELVKKGYVEPGFVTTADNQIASFLVTGKVAMFYSGTHMFKQIQDADPKFEFGWFALPDDKGKVDILGGSQLSGWSYSVNTEKDADKKAAAIAWIKSWYEKDNYVDYLQKMSAFPVTKEKFSFKYPIPGMDKVLEALNKADYKDLNWNMKWGENELPAGFRDYAYKCLQEVMVNGSSVEEMAKKLDTEWENKAKDFNPTVKK